MYAYVHTYHRLYVCPFAHIVCMRVHTYHRLFVCPFAHFVCIRVRVYCIHMCCICTVCSCPLATASSLRCTISFISVRSVLASSFFSCNAPLSASSCTLPLCSSIFSVCSCVSSALARPLASCTYVCMWYALFICVSQRNYVRI